jgi:hypothetical protein
VFRVCIRYVFIYIDINIYISLQRRTIAHLRCFGLLNEMVGLLRLGPEGAMLHMDRIEELIRQHHEAMVRLYGDNCKPKAHHLHHVPDGARWVSKLFACYVTERKHKSVKQAALYIFRNFEHTLINDVLNRFFEQMGDGVDIYTQRSLVNGSYIGFGDRQFCQSRRAIIHVGEVAHGDIVLFRDGVVGMILGFWQLHGDEVIYINSDCFECLTDTRFRNRARSRRVVYESQEVLDVCIYYEHSPNVIRVSLHPALYAVA